MNILLLVIGMAFAGCCVWLTVRIVNRKERWAKWTAVAVVLLAYPLSFGPACWIASRSFPQNHHAFRMVYRPIGNFAYWRVPVLPSLVLDYARLWLPKGGTVVIPGGPNADGTEIAIRRD